MSPPSQDRPYHRGAVSLGAQASVSSTCPSGVKAIIPA